MGRAQGWNCGLFSKEGDRPGALDLTAGLRDLGLQEGEASHAAEITSSSSCGTKAPFEAPAHHRRGS